MNGVPEQKQPPDISMPSRLVADSINGEPLLNGMDAERRRALASRMNNLLRISP